MEFTKEQFFHEYYNLSTSFNKEIRDKANLYIIEFQKSNKAWDIAQEIFINPPSPELQFLGIQLLTKKIKSDFMSLPSDAQNTLKEFIFQRLNNALGTTTKLVFSQMCISAALIAIFLLTSTWSNFFEDLFNFMHTGSQNLMAGLEILDAFAGELDQVVLERKKLIKIKCLVLEQIPDKFIEMFELLLQQSPDQRCLEKTLQAIKTWCGIKLQILQYSQKIIELLLGIFEKANEEQMILITDIIVESLKGSLHADILDSSNLLNAEKLISANERLNIQKIIEFLGVRHLEKFMQHLTNQQSIFSRCYTEILSIAAEKFPIFILENTEFSHAMIKLLLMTTSHASLSISHLTFEFWISFYQIIKKNVPNIKEPSWDYLIVPFVDLFKIVLDKCKLRSFKLKVKGLSIYNSPRKQKNLPSKEGLEDEIMTGDDEEENSGNRVSLNSYRGYSEDIFYNVYRVLSEFREEQGIQLFFSLISERLGREFYLNKYPGLKQDELMIEYILTIEATLFAAKSMLDNIIFVSSNSYIHELLKIVITNIPYEGVIIKTALQLIYDASEQLKFSQDIVEDVYKFVLQFILDEKLGKLASQCFNSLTENLPKHQMGNICDLVFEFIERNIDSLEDEYIYENLIQGLFNIGWKISDPQLNQQYIIRNLTLIDNKFHSFNNEQIKNPTVFKKICNIIVSALSSIDFQSENNNQIDIKSLLEPFIDKNLSNITRYFIEWSNQLSFIELYTKVFKYILKFLQSIALKYFSLIFNTTFKLFQLNPKQNSFVLGVFSLTLSILDNDPGLGVWLKGNGSELNKFLIETINKNKDPDLIKNFTILQVKILLYDELIFLECKEFDEIMKVLLDSLLEINEYSMTKEILLFFNSFMGVPKGIHHPNMMKFLPEIIKCFIFSLPEINRNFLIYLIHAFQALIKTYGMNNNELYLFIRNLLNDGRFTCLTEKQKDIFVDCLFAFLDYNRQMKVFLNDFTNYLSKTANDDVFMNMEMQMKEVLNKKNQGVIQTFE